MSHKRFRSNPEPQSTHIPPSLSCHASRFLDLEAAVEDEDSEPWEDESDGESFFAADDSDVEASSSSRPQYTWAGIECAQDDDPLIAIADDIRRRHQASTTAAPMSINFDTETFRLPPVLEDPPIWRVRTKKNCERDVVVAILCRAMKADSPLGIVSAIQREAIPRSIYVEAHSSADVANVLEGLYGVRRSQNGSAIFSRISLDDQISLLRMSGVSELITRGSWVRIMRPMLYRNDLAFVREVSRVTFGAIVCVVPRIQLYRKRRRGDRKRPSAKLFDREEVRDLYGDNAVKERNQGYIFEERFYRGGLAEFEVLLVDLSSTSVNPTKQELFLFHNSKSLLVISAVDAFNSTSSLRVEDKIHVISGPHRGLSGRVTAIHDGNVVAIDVDGLPELKLRRWEISRLFSRGDHVHVIAGPNAHRDKHGFIIDMDEKTATICSLMPGSQSGLPVDEFVVSLDHIQWKSCDVLLRKMQSSLEAVRIDEDVDIRFAYTGDPYVGMEVSIHTGELKNHFACIKGTRVADGKTLATLRTDTRTINHMIEINIDKLRERHTRLPLSKAIWIPRLRSLPAPPDMDYGNRPRTPQPVPESSDIPLSPAWCPSPIAPVDPLDEIAILDAEIARLERRLESSNAGLSSRQPQSPQPTPGEWLLDPRLHNKKLDVRVLGTSTTLFHNGRFEDECAVLTISKRLTSVSDSVVVRMGYNQSTVRFQIRYLCPEFTTEVPMAIRHASASPARPIFQVVGQRVVVIGADSEGKVDLIGHYAIIIHCIWPLAPDQACVQMLASGPLSGHIHYFPAKSLCRSAPEEYYL